MSDIKDKDLTDVEGMEFSDPVIVVTDEEGNEEYYIEEEVFSVGEDKYAILVPMGQCGGCDDAECGDCTLDASEDDEDEAIIAKIILDENGEEVYCEPSDEEFELARQAYDKLLEEEEE